MTGLRPRQMIVGLIALPLSILPFAAYLTWTPEGRLVRDRVLVAVNPPTLPRLSAAQLRRGVVPAYGGAVMVLAYHGIGSASDAEGGFAVSPERFGEHLVSLRHAGMKPVTAAQVAEAFAGGQPLPERALMITFDDGRTDALMFADPLLEQAGMTATMFVITGAASDPGLYYAGWDRLEQAARSGRWDLQSHTEGQHREQKVGRKRLPLLTSLASGESVREYRHRVRDDLATASTALEEHVGQRPVALAYPFGAYGADRTNHPAISGVLREEVSRQHQLAFQQDEQDEIPLATPFDDRTALRRLEVGDWSGPQLLRRVAAAADRTAASVERRQSELLAQLERGGTPPAGVSTASDGTLAAPSRSSSLSPSRRAAGSVRRRGGAPSATRRFAGAARRTRAADRHATGVDPAAGLDAATEQLTATEYLAAQFTTEHVAPIDRSPWQRQWQWERQRPPARATRSGQEVRLIISRRAHRGRATVVRRGARPKCPGRVDARSGTDRGRPTAMPRPGPGRAVGTLGAARGRRRHSAR